MQPSVARTLLVMTKWRVNIMVVLTTVVGALMVGGRGDVGRLFAVAVGTFLLAAASAVFNALLERDIDASMERTSSRPLAAATINAGTAGLFGFGLAVFGALLLGLFTNALTLGLGLATMTLYLFVYTPLKRVTYWSTHIGAIPGALPPMMGWAAFQFLEGPQPVDGSSGALAWLEQLRALIGPESVIAWILFGILFFWQLPHFFAIAWKYRDDYKRGGLQMLSVVEPTGVACGWHSVVTATLLLAVSVLPYLLGIAGPIYLVIAVASGGAMVMRSWRFLRRRRDGTARALLLTSLFYLPVVLTALVIDRLG